MIRLVRGDITKIAADAIVNAANAALAGGGGVDGAIHRAGGPAIMAECDAIRSSRGGCPTGHAVITTGGRLKARHVIHAVGPVWRGGENGEAAQLASAYRESLALAAGHGLRRVVFPCISTGIYGFPKDRAAAVAVETMQAFLTRHPEMEISVACFDDENFTAYEKLLA
jgi:O-acetyl-ADP-ribose deacetylase (regulator of RNase III)